MTINVDPAHSLRTRLLWLLMGAVLIAAMSQGISVYRSALRDADEVFDYHMRQMAMALRPGLSGTGADPAGGNLDWDENFEFLVQAWGSDGAQLYGSTTRMVLPQRAVLGFSDIDADGTTYRVFSVQTPSRVIQVAQDKAIRRQMAGKLAMGAVTPILLLMPLLMLLVWWAVSHSLGPIARVRHQVARRQADDLSPVSEAGLPDEVRPLVKELNLLFGRVRSAFEAQRHFVADAAHELRSPLAALKLQAALLQRAENGDARGIAITRLTAGIDRATRLVEQLLVLARHEAGVATGIKVQATSLAKVGRMAVADTAADARARGVDVGFSGDGELCVEGDPDALRILVRNLLDNAIKYTPSGGVIDVSAGISASEISLCVEDSGPGIPVEDREKVLNRFYRVRGTEASGSGLGLAIVKSIADLHGARLALDQSERLGGLRARIGFPKARGR